MQTPEELAEAVINELEKERFLKNALLQIGKNDRLEEAVELGKMLNKLSKTVLKNDAVTLEKLKEIKLLHSMKNS